jgi:phage-related protein
MGEGGARRERPVVWVGSSKRDLLTFPRPVIAAVGFALYQAQVGRTHAAAKPLKGFAGAGVLEIVEDHDVYTVRLAGAVYVLHAFQKKSVRGATTPRRHLDLVKARLRDAEAIARSGGSGR